jgi:hypothetical protein
MFGQNSPASYITEAFNSESKALTTAVQRFDAKKVNLYGHIVALDIKASVTITKGTGVIDTTKAIAEIVDQIIIRDRDSRPIIDDAGSRLPIIRKILTLFDSPFGSGDHKKGEYDASGSLTDVATAQVYQALIPIDINIADQPISVEWKLAAIGTMCSTVGTATATGQIQITTVNVVSPEVATRETRRIYSYTRGAVATKQKLQDSLPTGVTIDNITIGETTDSNLTAFTLLPTAERIGVNDLPQATIESIEARELFDGHTTAFHTIIHSPFKVGDSTVMMLEPSTSYTPRFFITHRGVL